MFYEIDEKIFYLQNRKVRKKNEISKYHSLSLKKSIRTIHKKWSNKKPTNLVKNWKKKLKDLWSIIGKKFLNLIEY